MTLDLHDHLAALAERGGSDDDAPTSHILARVHRRRAARTTATAAVGIAAAGAIALVAANGWPTTSSPAPAATVAPPEPTTDTVVPQPTTDTSDDDATDPDGAPTVGVWDLFPDSTLDLVAVQEHTGTTEVLAALPMMAGDAWAVYLLDSDGVWTRAPWLGPERGHVQTTSLTPDGREVVMTIVDGTTTLIVALGVADGTTSEPGPLTVDGEPFIVSGADISPDGTTLAVVGTTENEGGPVVVGAIDLPLRDVTGDGSGIEVRTLVRYTAMSLDHSGGIAYSPDGSLLAVGTTDVADGREYTTILDAGGLMVLRWPMAMAPQPWYGNDALRVTGPSPDDGTAQSGYLQVSTVTTTTMTDIGEAGPDYGTPPPPDGRTIGQFVTATGDPSGAFRIEDGATGQVRTWLTVVVPDGWSTPGQLLQRTR